MSDFFNEQYKKEWRELGFFYEYDSDKNVWNLYGAKNGIINFVTKLREYAININYSPISEHIHLGPDSYLKVVTWNEPIIQSDGIYGTQRDILKLSDILLKELEKNKTLIQIDKEYSSNNKATIYIHIKEDNFDPASLDIDIW